MATKEAPKRYRFSVPAEDVSTIKWLESQVNIGYSLRHLIREDIQRNGFMDATCHEVEQGPKRGRPTLAEVERQKTEQVESVETIEEETPKHTEPAKALDEGMLALLK